MTRGLFYDVENPYSKATGLMGDASQSYASMTRKDPNANQTEPTVGGAIMSGLGAANTAATIGEMAMAGPVSVSGAATAGIAGLGLMPVAGIGALVGIGAYLFSPA